MGPRHRCRGNNATVSAALPAGTLQWGRGIDAAEMAAGLTGGTRAITLQWGRGIDAAEMAAGGNSQASPYLRFNGAAASMPRK